MTIHKYDLPEKDAFTLELPRGAKILAIQTQNAKPKFWALVNAKAVKVKRNFVCVGTGHEFDGAKKKYVGTYQQHGGALVLHVFEVTK